MVSLNIVTNLKTSWRIRNCQVIIQSTTKEIPTDLGAYIFRNGAYPYAYTFIHQASKNKQELFLEALSQSQSSDQL